MGQLQSLVEDDVVSCDDPEHEPTKSEIRQEETHRLVECQKDLFKTGKTFPIEYRLSLLNKLRCLFETNIKEFSQALAEDLKCSRDVLEKTHFKCVENEFKVVFDRLNELKQASNSSEIIFEPAGSVLILGTFTYPITACIIPAMAALAAGNVVVIKPSELAPKTAAALSETFAEAFEEDQLAVIPGDQWTAKELLNEAWDHILFVGPHRVAKFVLSAAAQRLTPVTVELLGKSAVLVLPSADLNAVAKDIVQNKWNANGELLHAIDYAICYSEEDVHSLVAALSHEAVAVFGENPEESANFKRVLNHQMFDKIQNVLTKTEGDLLWNPPVGFDSRTEYYIAPYVYKVDEDDVLLKEEILGPILPILLVESTQDSIDFINKYGEKPSNVRIYGSDQERLDKLQRQIRAERVTVVNGEKVVKYGEFIGECGKR
uniref:Aldedh domain-containing protein n=1 Tax=Bursaphelenchus xylophilus TaxID=6326 RepID=A0A1I7RUE4_BURXY